MRRYAAYSLWPRMEFRNATVCAGVHTATAGRIRVRYQCSTRALVQTTARPALAG
jgi:hypothetical protein